MSTDPVGAALERIRQQHRQHVSTGFPAPGICVSRCAEAWPCAAARLAHAVAAVRDHVRDGDGNYLPPDCHVPAGGIQAAVIDALAGPANWEAEPVSDGPAPEYLVTFRDFWAPIVQSPDGTLNFGQVARELADYHDLIGRASEVYDSVTGGRLSKPSTLPAAVIEQAQERVDEAVNDEIAALVDGLRDRQGAPYQSTGAVVAAICEITGRDVPDLAPEGAPDDI